jgi:hypothetical protein
MTVPAQPPAQRIKRDRPARHGSQGGIGGAPASPCKQEKLPIEVRRLRKTPAPWPPSLAKVVPPRHEKAHGEMAEWLKAHAWKACVRETVPWVRIPLSPPFAADCTPWCDKLRDSRRLQYAPRWPACHGEIWPLSVGQLSVTICGNRSSPYRNSRRNNLAGSRRSASEDQIILRPQLPDHMTRAPLRCSTDYCSPNSPAWTVAWRGTAQPTSAHSRRAAEWSRRRSVARCIALQRAQRQGETGVIRLGSHTSVH